MKRLLGLPLLVMVGCGGGGNADNAVDPSVFAEKQLATESVAGREDSSNTTAEAAAEAYVLWGSLLLMGLMFMGLALFFFNMPKPGEQMNRVGIAGVMVTVLGMAAFMVGVAGYAIYNTSNSRDRGMLIGLFAVATVLAVISAILKVPLGRGARR